MINYQYEKEAFSTFQEGIRREWALTNGIGGYAGSSLIGAHNRTHQGYLIASLHPPIERYLVFSKINESLSVFAAESTGSSDEKFHPITDTLKKGSVPAVSAVYNLETSQHKKNGETCYTQGQEYLVSFSYDGSVHYTYQAGDITMKKHICLKHGANVCAIAYEIENNGPDASLTLVPLFNFREHSASSRPEDFHFRTSLILPFCSRPVKVFFPTIRLCSILTCSFRPRSILRRTDSTVIIVHMKSLFCFRRKATNRFPCSVP